MWEENSLCHHSWRSWLEACIMCLWWAIYSDRQRPCFPPSVTFIGMYLIKVISSHIELIPQTEYASEVFLNDFMVWFLPEAPLELILTGDFKCSLLKTEAVVHWSVLPDMSANARELGFNPWDRKVPWKREWQPTPVFLPGKSHGQRNLEG